MKKSFYAIALFVLTAAINSTASLAQSNNNQTVWTIDEILSERQQPVQIDNPRMCDGNRFKPCVCAPDVTKSVQYRPSVTECDGRAAIILSGEYLRAFSVVVRNRANADRHPIIFPVNAPGYGGCTLAVAKTGLAKCSAYKVQKIIRVKNEGGNAVVHCLGQSGYTDLMKDISRITVKLQDVPGSHADPLERLCLWGATVPLN